MKTQETPRRSVKIPDFSWHDSRAAGVFLHISALPSECGIGNVGRAADKFFDFLEEAGMTWWQICPLGPTGYGDSPYQSFSTFAGNPYFIDLEDLAEAGLLECAELEPLKALPSDRCDFGALYCNIPALLRTAAERWRKNGADSSVFGFEQTFDEFRKLNAHWLDSYALFTALKRKNGGKPWYEWRKDLRNFETAIDMSAEVSDEIFATEFSQWVFFSQYAKFKAKAKTRGINIFGDIPIFVAHDSADVWANRGIFDLYADGTTRTAAGVGPDYFSAEGQFWGNPLYNWDGKKAEVFEFWRRRVAVAVSMYDAIRFDHFRGFADYWAIPSKTKDARKGSWKLGPDVEFFAYLKRHFPENKFVAEDLGLLSERAMKLRDEIKIPAMAVMQFAFGSDAENPYFPHNVKRECVYYTGTHDNDTACGWYASATESAKDQLRRYFRSAGDVPNWDMIHAVLLSVSRLAIIPMQDILGLPSSCRFNTPGKPDGNWQWRATAEQLETARIQNAPYLKSIAELGGRFSLKKETTIGKLEK